MTFRWQVGTPSSIWMQCANVSFLLAGIFGDILLVRLFLLAGNIWLLVAAMTGFPLWPNLIGSSDPVILGLDTVIWAIIGLYVHASSFLRLLLDERPVELNEEEEAMWRMFYRSSGISRIVFKSSLLKNGEFKSFPRGHVLTSADARERFIYILLQGHVKATLHNGTTPDLDFYSGEIFEFRYLNLLGFAVGFLKSSMTAKVASDSCRVFRIPLQRFEEMAQAPDLKQAWQAVTLSAMSRAAERQHFADDQPERDPMKLAPVFDPLSDDELPSPFLPGSGDFWARPLRHIAHLLATTFSPPYPFSRQVLGMRHTQSRPPAGERAARMVKNTLGTMEESLLHSAHPASVACESFSPSSTSRDSSFAIEMT